MEWVTITGPGGKQHRAMAEAVDLYRAMWRAFPGLPFRIGKNIPKPGNPDRPRYMLTVTYPELARELMSLLRELMGREGEDYDADWYINEDPEGSYGAIDQSDYVGHCMHFLFGVERLADVVRALGALADARD